MSAGIPFTNKEKFTDACPARQEVPHLPRRSQGSNLRPSRRARASYDDRRPVAYEDYELGGRVLAHGNFDVPAHGKPGVLAREGREIRLGNLGNGCRLRCHPDHVKYVSLGHEVHYTYVAD